MIKPWLFEFFPELGDEARDPAPAEMADYATRYLDLWTRDEALGFEGPNQIAAEVRDADDAVAGLGRRQVHAVKRHQPPWHEHPMQLAKARLGIANVLEHSEAESRVEGGVLEGQPDFLARE